LPFGPPGGPQAAFQEPEPLAAVVQAFRAVPATAARSGRAVTALRNRWYKAPSVASCGTCHTLAEITSGPRFGP